MNLILFCTRKTVRMEVKRGLLILTVVFLTGILLFIMYCGKRSCFNSPLAVIADIKLPTSAFGTYLHSMLPMNEFVLDDLDKRVELNFEKDDVIVFAHIQKTGGTSFGRHLVRDLKVEPPCHCVKKRKRCDCYTKNNRIWLFSRYSTGWLCGLHADWTELTNCVSDAMLQKEKVSRRKSFHYITILRDPVRRFLSEWRHVQRGATWKKARLFCGGRSATLEEVPFCYNGSDWSDVLLDEFLACKSNLAFNRQSRMLADLNKIDCYNTSNISKTKRDHIMLQSAKENLLQFVYFGMTEFQQYSQQLFQFTFNLKFRGKFEQNSVSRSSGINITEKQKDLILNGNSVDIEFYQFAKDLFLQRVRKMKQLLHDDSDVYDYELTKGRFDEVEDIDDDSDDDNYEEDAET